MSESDKYYQKEMGREWLIRKEMILAIVQTSIGNTDYSIKIMNGIESKHKEMLDVDQYGMVRHFISAIKTYIKNPHEADQKILSLDPLRRLRPLFRRLSFCANCRDRTMWKFHATG